MIRWAGRPDGKTAPAGPPWLRLATLVVLLALVAWLMARLQSVPGPPTVVELRPEGIMGTGCTLARVEPPNEPDGISTRTLESAEAELRRLEGLLSLWIHHSELSQLNAAPADEPIPVSPELHHLLTSSQRLQEATDGAFDVTLRPLVELWRSAREAGLEPTPERIRQARAASGWDLIELDAAVVVKRADSLRLDLDGIAKGYAIDRALQILRDSKALGGLVEIGGDLAVYGTPPSNGPWRVEVRSPFDQQIWASIAISEGAVCSSGDYARPVEIAGRRFSHILDPRTGRPVDDHPAVTVVAPDAMTADAWATALTVLGRRGLGLLPAGLEALLVEGDPRDFQVWVTPGMAAALRDARFDAITVR